MTWRCGHSEIDLSVPRVMGIVNVTPDSFSDGGRYFRPEEAVRRVRNLADEGAVIVDLGAESTRPGATPISADEEWARLEPVLAILAEKPERCPVLSVDTYHPETARRAIVGGVSAVNCVYAEPAAEMIALAAESGCGLVLPGSVADEELARAACPAAVLLDPEIGFTGSRGEDVARLHALPSLAKRAAAAGFAGACAGVSRKRIVKHLVGEKAAGKDLAGSLALALWCAAHGAALLRVHDVAETVRGLKVFEALAEGAAS